MRGAQLLASLSQDLLDLQSAAGFALASRSAFVERTFMTFRAPISSALSGWTK